jgi:hypothetical protein
LWWCCWYFQWNHFGILYFLYKTPLDHARFRVSLDKSVKAEGSIKTAVNIYREYGLKKVFLGMNAAILREVLGLAFYFGIYDKLMISFRKDG